jgi:hypothetical protein
MTMYALCHMSRSVALAYDQWRAAKAVTKALAKQATEIGREVREQSLGAKATVLGQAIAKQRQQRKSIERVGEYTRKLDTALPGKHTRLLYDSFKRTDASILAQLRTGMKRLNGYLHRNRPMYLRPG